MNRVIVHDTVARQWVLFQHPVETVVARTADQVLPALDMIEREVDSGKLHAAGFIAYEAAPAFDSVLRVRPDPASFPLLWFGLFREAVRQDTRAFTRGASYTSPAWTPSIGRTEYNHALSQLRDYLRRGDTYQVNYTFRLTSPFNGDPWALFCQLMRSQQSGHAAFVETETFAICSASPELFFSLEGDCLKSRPMKGTAPRGRSAIEDLQCAEVLQTSLKNRAENVMIVDMVRNDMGRIAIPGSVEPVTLFSLERYPTVWQMTSTVTARTHASVQQILTALFPCASITGAPKRRTMEIIAEIETTPRRIYTGAIGFIAPHRRAEFNVAIRTVLINKQAGAAEYGVGGGIVWDSDSRDEYDECWTKARILTEQVPEFELLETLLWSPAEGFFLIERHLARLSSSADYFDIRVSIPEVRSRLQNWSRSVAPSPHRVRLLVTREGAVRLAAQTIAATDNDKRVSVCLADRPVDPSDRFLYHKTTRRHVYERAKADHPESDDVVLWNPDGEITESTVANVVADLDGHLITPPAGCGLLAGTFREELLAAGTIREALLRRVDLPRCRHLYLINSVRKWREASFILQQGVA